MQGRDAQRRRTGDGGMGVPPGTLRVAAASSRLARGWVGLAPGSGGAAATRSLPQSPPTWLGPWPASISSQQSSWPCAGWGQVRRCGRRPAAQRRLPLLHRGRGPVAQAAHASGGPRGASGNPRAAERRRGARFRCRVTCVRRRGENCRHGAEPQAPHPQTPAPAAGVRRAIAGLVAKRPDPCAERAPHLGHVVHPDVLQDGVLHLWEGGHGHARARACASFRGCGRRWRDVLGAKGETGGRRGTTQHCAESAAGGGLRKGLIQSPAPKTRPPRRLALGGGAWFRTGPPPRKVSTLPGPGAAPPSVSRRAPA
jgi:hypothetical protein